MDKERILEILRAHEAELKAAGLLHLRLFGSVARGESTPESDIDLLADFDESLSLDLITVVGFRTHLSKLIGADVHLSSATAMYPHIREKVLPEAIFAY